MKNIYLRYLMKNLGYSETDINITCEKDFENEFDECENLMIINDIHDKSFAFPDGTVIKTKFYIGEMAGAGINWTDLDVMTNDIITKAGLNHKTLNKGRQMLELIMTDEEIRKVISYEDECGTNTLLQEITSIPDNSNFRVVKIVDGDSMIGYRVEELK